MKRRSFFTAAFTLTLTLGLGVVSPAFAAAGGLIPCDGTNANPCTPCHLVQLLANIGQFLTGITGALVFAMFVYGSFMWIISAGNEKRVEKGKEIMINAFIGVLVVFLSYTIVTFFIFALTGKNPYNKDEQILFGRTWGQLIECSTETPAPKSAAPASTAAPSAQTPAASATPSFDITALQKCSILGEPAYCFTEGQKSQARDAGVANINCSTPGDAADITCDAGTDCCTAIP